jgi:metal-responsive CopG/Arc/MetJ family transcriptional regulator
MPRTIVDLPSSQLRDLDSRCRSLGISRAEAVRRAVQAFLRESPGDSSRAFDYGRRGRRASRAGDRARVGSECGI